MRTIKFRGKRVDSEMWVYGDLITLDVNDKGQPARDGLFISIDSGRFKFEVVPETVGQFTGKTDKSGVEIYRGDLIKSNDVVISPNDRMDAKTVKKRIVVEWDEDKNGWNLPIGDKADWEFMEIEIIDNIYDNKTLK